MKAVASDRTVGSAHDQRLWYKQAAVHWVSIETFMDANGDGVGDFQGLARWLDHLAGLGMTAVWQMLPDHVALR